ncbi:oxidoreductase [Algibacter aquimarinus]|uniref:Oxidoreductase n=1 Tax=Algibacter aquimarinus TaxID=1136748 RepID=A0ABP9H5Q2_9FLAO
MKYFIVPLVVVFFFSCGKKETFKPRDFSEVEIEHLMQDSLLNVRAIEIDSSKSLGFATSNGEFGGTVADFKGEKAIVNTKLKHDTIIPNFRALGVTNRAVFIFSISTPALLYKVTHDSINLVYQENHPKAFYDSMDFWNNQEGIAIGDSTDGCLSVIITRDGGNTWSKLPCDELPKGLENEGAFAASDTNIAIIGDNTWVATTAGRVYYSPDKGETWEVYDTPIIKEQETEGIYSIDFYDELNGFAIGGDYTKPNENTANKIRTTDGGKTWKIVADGMNPGYRSCVQYIPNRKGKELVAIGFKGIDYSNDSGNSWKHLSDEGFYTIRFLNDSIAYAAGKGRVSKLIFREKKDRDY